jgi:hypothetical protein
LGNYYNEKSIPAPESRDCENLSTGTTVPEKVRDPGIPVSGIPGLEALIFRIPPNVYIFYMENFYGPFLQFLKFPKIAKRYFVLQNQMFK